MAGGAHKVAVVACISVKMLLSVDREADYLAVLGQAFKVTVDGAETDVHGEGLSGGKGVLHKKIETIDNAGLRAVGRH